MGWEAEKREAESGKRKGESGRSGRRGQFTIFGTFQRRADLVLNIPVSATKTQPSLRDLDERGIGSPRLKPWAIVVCPPETGTGVTDDPKPILRRSGGGSAQLCLGEGASRARLPVAPLAFKAALIILTR